MKRIFLKKPRMIFQKLTILTNLANLAFSQTCFDKLTATEYWQSVATPQYPLPFNPSTRCVWRIEAPQGFRVKIEFIDFLLLEQPSDMQCSAQSVSILNIDGEGIGKFCGNAKPQSIVSLTRGLNIQLLSENVPYDNNYRVALKKCHKNAQIHMT